MADIDQIVNVNISIAGAAPTGTNNGTPAILAYHTHNTDYARSYNSLSGMVSDSFTTTEPAYLLASSIVQQNPHVPQFVVIRGSHEPTQTFSLNIHAPITGAQVGLSVYSCGNGSVADGISYPLYVTSSGTASTDATALAAVSTPAHLTASVVGSTVTWTAAAGYFFYPFEIFPGTSGGGGFLDTTGTTDSTLPTSIATDCNNANQATNGGFYSVSPQYIDSPTIAATALWVQTNEKLMFATTADNSNLDSTVITSPATNPIMVYLKSLSDARCYVQFGGTPDQFGATALAAQRFTAFPGSDNYAYKTLAGVAPDDYLTTTQKNNIVTNKGNYYVTISGEEVTYPGQSSSGQFIDIQRGLDALRSDIQVRIFGLLVSVPKVPYTAAGIAAVGGEVAASLAYFTQSGFLSGDPGFTYKVILPDLASIPVSDVQNRVLPGVQFIAYLANAINTVQIQGNINFP